MQPANNNTSRKSTVGLLNGGKYLFDLTNLGARLQAVFYGSRCCTVLKNYTTPLSVKEPADNEISLKTTFMFGALASTRCVIAKQCQKY